MKNNILSKFFVGNSLNIKNIERNVFLFLIVGWVLVIFVFSVINLRLKFISLKIKKEAASKKMNRFEPKDISFYNELLDKILKPEDFSFYKKLQEKDIFFEEKKAVAVETPPVFEIREIKKIPLPIMYKGFIEQEDRTLVAQINWNNETIFVKKGDKVKNFRIIELTKDGITLIDSEKKKFLLKYNKATYGDEFQVTFFDSSNKKTLTLKKNDTLGLNYKIIDITDDSVILLQNSQKIIFKKGEKLNG